MKLSIPLLPSVIAVALLGSVIYYLSTVRSPSGKHFGAPVITRVGEFEGTETEVAIAPDGKEYATIVSGELWLLNVSDGSRAKLSETLDAESDAAFPSWTPDGRIVTYTRGSDTWAIDVPDARRELQQNLRPHSKVWKANATSLEWAPSGRIAFVRDRALWLANSAGKSETELVPADPNPDITLHSPRFSPDSLQLSFIRTTRGRTGEVWLADLLSGEKHALVADRPAENPLDTGWILDGKQLVYLTDRSGTYALWTVNFEANTLLTLTGTLNPLPLARIGMSVLKDRIVLPRHFVNSSLALSDGTSLVHSDSLEFEPAVSPDGKQLAYTVLADDKFTIWTSGIHGESPVLHGAGREPRWAGNDYELVFTHTDLTGNPEIWKLDLRTNETQSLTDTPEIDREADWRPNGRTVAFSSNHTVEMAIWSVPANGGPRVQLNNNGYFPRYTPDGNSILYWSGQAFWTMNPTGGGARSLRSGIEAPAPAVLTRTGPKYYRDPEVNGGKNIWPQFDVLQDGRYVIAPIEIRDTALWAVDLTFTAQ